MLNFRKAVYTIPDKKATPEVSLRFRGHGSLVSVFTVQIGGLGDAFDGRIVLDDEDQAVCGDAAVMPCRLGDIVDLVGLQLGDIHRARLSPWPAV